MRKIKLFFAAMALLVTALAYGQNITVTGTVIDSSNDEPIPFASIQLKGTMTGANTDLDGNFTIKVSEGTPIIISYIGYLSQEVKASANMKELRIVGLSTQRSIEK